MRKVFAITTLIAFGSALHWSAAQSMPPATAIATTSNIEKQTRLNWFDDAVGDILTGDHDAHTPVAPASRPRD